MLRFGSAFILTLFLSACSFYQPVSETEAKWQLHQEVLQQMNQWELRGKIAIITPDERNSTALWMKESEDSSQLVLSDPLGGRIMAARETPEGASLQLRDGQTFSGPDMQTLLNLYSPFPVPLAQLRNWIKGLPDGANYQLNNNGQANLIEQGGWQADLDRYRADEGIDLPYEINLNHESVDLKIRVSNWRL